MDDEPLELLHFEILDLLLSAYFKEKAPDRLWEGVSPIDGENAWRITDAVFLKSSGLVSASLKLRTEGPEYLRYSSVSDIIYLLRNFFRDNYWRISSIIDKSDSKLSFDKIVPVHIKIELSIVISESSIFKPNFNNILYPISIIDVEDNYFSDYYSLLSPHSLSDYLKLPSSSISGNFFPPLSKTTIRQQPVSAWLAVKAPVVSVGEKWKRIILGALALAPIPRERHMFTLRSVTTGYCVVQNGITTSTGPAHTPSLGSTIKLNNDDNPWLRIISAILHDNDKRRERNSLEYYYRAWFLGPSERCATLYVALDAIFGEKEDSSKSVLTNLVSLLGLEKKERRVRSLLKIRNSVIHGGAPNIFDSTKYEEYFRIYEADPVYDLDILTGKCLQKHIFGENFRSQSDPYEDLIREHQTLGTIPEVFHPNAIMLP